MDSNNSTLNQVIMTPISLDRAMIRNLILPQIMQPPLNPQVLPNITAAQVVGIGKNNKVRDEYSRDVVCNVLNLCTEERIKNKLTAPLMSVSARVRYYTRIPHSTVRRIRCHRKTPHDQRFKPIRRKRDFKTILDDRDIIIIKDIIRDHYIKQGTVPIISDLFTTIVDKIFTYKSSTTVLHGILRNIGYIRKKYYSTRSVLMEDPVITSHRDKYLKTIKELRTRTENIFYIYECVIDKSYTLHKAWPQKYGYNRPLNDKNTFTFICAASKNGFLRNSGLMRKTNFNSTKHEFGGQVNDEFFLRWMNLYLIPNLPKYSVVIMENAPHHCGLKETPITFDQTKEEMLNYLKKKQIFCDKSMRRSQLFKLIEQNPQDNIYVIDSILKEQGHTVLRLPPYMTDLSVAQAGMDKIQAKLLDFDCGDCFDLRTVLNIFGELMLSIDKASWTGFFEQVVQLEMECWKKDGEYEEALDKILLNSRNRADSGSEESDLNCSDRDSN